MLNAPLIAAVLAITIATVMSVQVTGPTHATLFTVRWLLMTKLPIIDPPLDVSDPVVLWVDCT